MYSSLIFIDPFSFLLFIVSIVVQRMMFKCSLNSPSPFIECIHLFLMKYEVIIQCILFLLLFIHSYSMIVSSYIQTSLESAIYEADKNVFLICLFWWLEWLIWSSDPQNLFFYDYKGQGYSIVFLFEATIW